ncbi:MAG: zinc ribbon domain-containing protein [Actinobacteria bacterium]|nr:zinc ribbon domain-containing protein [Actinomycetota bacterium]
MLSGVLICGLCGRRFTGAKAGGNGGTYRYYICPSRAQLGTGRCSQHRLRADALEDAVMKHLIRNLKDSKVLKVSVEKAEQRMEGVRPKLQRELGQTERKLRDIRSSIDRYLRAFETGSMPSEVCAPRLAELDARKTELETHREEIQGQLDSDDSAADLEEVRDVAADWARRLEDAEMPLLKHLIRTLVREVRVESRASIRPVIHLPMVRVTSRWVGRQGLEPCPPD